MQQNGYVPAVSAANRNNRDWAGEITPPARMRSALDTGIGGMSENEMTGMEMQNNGMNGMQNSMQGGMNDMRNNDMNSMQNGGMNGTWHNGMNSMQGSGRNQMQNDARSGMQMPGRARQNGTLDMRNDLPDDVIESPATNAEVYAGSTKAMLRRNLGNYVVATFLVGTQNTVSWEGVLYDVGNDYVTIYQPGRDRYIVNDIYSLRYTEFYDVRRRQLCDQLMRDQGWDVEENQSPFG